MAIVLAENNYGKSRVRLVKVERHGTRHDLKDISVDISLSGEAFVASYVAGDNSLVVPTDTMKNTVYAFAKQTVGEIEEFGIRLAGHFLTRHPHIAEARITISENVWKRILVDDKPHDHSFLDAGGGRRTTVVTSSKRSTAICSGVSDLTVLKTTRSAFEGYVRDEFTTLKETKDRLFGTVVKVEWNYRSGKHNYGEIWNEIRNTILEVFATHDSRGVQHTLYAMGEKILGRFNSIEDIHISMPNRHCLLVDLSPFGMDNPNEVFVPVDEPHGLIEATVKRSGS